MQKVIFAAFCLLCCDAGSEYSSVALGQLLFAGSGVRFNHVRSAPSTVAKPVGRRPPTTHGGLTRRALVITVLAPLAASSLDPLPCLAALQGSDAELSSAYASGARASGGRGANTMIKERASTGVQRIGGDPLFSPGSILDSVRSNDGTAVDISFNFPRDWSVSKGPNLDVRDVRSSDSAFLLVAPLPKGKVGVEALPKKFYSDLIFAPEGKYGAYGGVDDFSIKDFAMSETKTPGGSAQAYRTFGLTFDVLTYNANTVRRVALVSATALGGSVFIVVSGCLGNRLKEAGRDLTLIQKSFRAYGASRARVAQLEAAAEADAEAAAANELEVDDMARSTVGATSVGRIGFRYEK